MGHWPRDEPLPSLPTLSSNDTISTKPAKGRITFRVQRGNWAHAKPDCETPHTALQPVADSTPRVESRDRAILEGRTSHPTSPRWAYTRHARAVGPSPASGPRLIFLRRVLCRDAISEGWTTLERSDRIGHGCRRPAARGGPQEVARNFRSSGNSSGQTTTRCRSWRVGGDPSYAVQTLQRSIRGGS